MSSFTPQELKDLYQALNVLIDEYVGLDAPNTMDRFYRLQDKIGNTIKEEKMKNIKFRIWNGNTKEWMTGSSKGIGGAQALGYASFLSEAVFPDYGATHNNIVVEQYTGLKDKNGKEVYEGDIVANGTLTGVVEYKVDDFCAWTVGATANGTVLLNGSWTVIGNVHEHPELLGKLTDAR